jgi:hypothetical protein
MKQLSALLLVLCLFGCGGGGSPAPTFTQSTGTNVCDQSNPANIGVSIAPDTVTLHPGNTQNFSPVLRYCVDSLVYPHLAWSIQEGAAGGSLVPTFNGAITQTYTAPATPGTYHIQVVYRFSGTQTKTGTATIIVQ